jgi:hypothetical protein
MANQQLLDYVKEQLKSGVAQAAIEKALLEAGWAQSDIRDCFVQAIQPAAAQPVMAKSAFTGSPAQQQPASQPVQRDFLSQSSATGGAMRMQTAETVVAAKPSGGKGGLIFGIVMLIVAIAAGGGAAWFYLQNGEKDKEVMNLKDALTQSSAKLSTIETDYRGQIESLQKQMEGLNKELAMLAEPSGGSAGESAVLLKGTILDEKGKGYRFLTDNKISFTIKNGKVAAVEAGLIPHLGSAVEGSFSHVQGTRELTILAINGQSVGVATTTATPPAQ